MLSKGELDFLLPVKVSSGMQELFLSNPNRGRSPVRARRPAAFSILAVAEPRPDIASRAILPKSVLAALGLAGAVAGPLLDGIHGTVHLLEYQAARVDILGLHSSLWVPVLLGAYYLVIGALFVLLDDQASGADKKLKIEAFSGLEQILSSSGNDRRTQLAKERQSWPLLTLNTGVVAALLALSAVLYHNGVPYSQILGILAVCAIINWRIFDGTKQGLALSMLSAVAAPLSELVIINVFGLWEYPHPNVFGAGGVPLWITCCYFFYTPAVGNLARLLVKK